MSGNVLFVVWALVADRAFTRGHSSRFASCLAGRSGRFGARVRSGLLMVEQQRSVGLRLGQLSGLLVLCALEGVKQVEHLAGRGHGAGLSESR